MVVLSLVNRRVFGCVWRLADMSGPCSVGCLPQGCIYIEGLFMSPPEISRLDSAAVTSETSGGG